MVGIIVYILSRVNWSTDKAVIEKWVIENKVFLEKIALIILIASAVVWVIFFILYVCISVNSCYLIGHKNSGGTKFWATLSLILGLGMVALWVYSIVQIWFTLDKTKQTMEIPAKFLTPIEWTAFFTPLILIFTTGFTKACVKSVFFNYSV